MQDAEKILEVLRTEASDTLADERELREAQVRAALRERRGRRTSEEIAADDFALSERAERRLRRLHLANALREARGSPLIHVRGETKDALHPLTGRRVRQEYVQERRENDRIRRRRHFTADRRCPSCSRYVESDRAWTVLSDRDAALCKGCARALDVAQRVADGGPRPLGDGSLKSERVAWRLSIAAVAFVAGYEAGHVMRSENADYAGHATIGAERMRGALAQVQARLIEFARIHPRRPKPARSLSEAHVARIVEGQRARRARERERAAAYRQAILEERAAEFLAAEREALIARRSAAYREKEGRVLKRRYARHARERERLEERRARAAARRARTGARVRGRADGNPLLGSGLPSADAV